MSKPIYFIQDDLDKNCYRVAQRVNNHYVVWGQVHCDFLADMDIADFDKALRRYPLIVVLEGKVVRIDK